VYVCAVAKRTQKALSSEFCERVYRPVGPAHSVLVLTTPFDEIRRSLTENTIPDAVLMQFDLLMMSTALLETCRGL